MMTFDVDNSSDVNNARGEDNSSPRRSSWRWSRRLRRVGFLVLGVAIGVLVLRIALGLVSGWRLSTQLASYRAEGVPVSVEEFNAELDAVPAADNAAVLYEQASVTYVGFSISGASIETFVEEPETFTTKPAIADELMEANAAVLGILREAREKPSVAWAERVGSWNPLLGSAQRMLARVLGFSFSYHVLKLDHCEAVETLRDFLRFNDAVDSHPTLLSSAIAWACHDLAFSLIERHGADLVVGAGRRSTNLTPATREQIEQLIRELLDEHRPRDAAVRSYLGSRAEYLQCIETTNMLDFLAPRATGLVANTPAKHVINFMMHPLLVLDLARRAEYDTLDVKAVSAKTWPEAARFFPDFQERSLTLLTHLARPVTCMGWDPRCGYSDKMVSRFFKTLARRRMAAIALAIRLHAVDHGRRPSQLTALTPLYLPELPRDPFTNSVQSFGYKPEAVRPFLYSVGLDGKDNEGKAVFQPDGRRDPERSDIVFYLEPEAVSSSSDDADDDDEHVEHEQGQQGEQDDGQPEPDER